VGRARPACSNTHVGELESSPHLSDPLRALVARWWQRSDGSRGKVGWGGTATSRIAFRSCGRWASACNLFLYDREEKSMHLVAHGSATSCWPCRPLPRRRPPLLRLYAAGIGSINAGGCPNAEFNATRVASNSAQGARVKTGQPLKTNPPRNGVIPVGF